MESADRLARHLAGELSPTEAAAVEALLARDPALSADLQAMRRADDALADLSSIAPPDGFDQRLRTAVDRELERALRPGQVVELAPRGRRTWTVPLAAAAAAVIGIAGIGILIDQRSAPDEDIMALTVPDAADAQPESAEPETGALLADPESDGTTEAFRAGELPAEPTVLVTNRDLTVEDLEAVLHSWELASVAGAALPDDDARALASDWRALLETGARPSTDVVTCLDTLGDDAALPVTVEVARFDGQSVLVFGLVVSDATGTAHTEPRVVVVTTDGCTVLATLPAE